MWMCNQQLEREVEPPWQMHSLCANQSHEDPVGRLFAILGLSGRMRTCGIMLSY